MIILVINSGSSSLKYQVREGEDVLAEGLVERIQNRGARVRAISLDEAIEITEVRMALEGLCAAKAAERATGEDRTELRRIGERMREAWPGVVESSSSAEELEQNWTDWKTDELDGEEMGTFWTSSPVRPP